MRVDPETKIAFITNKRGEIKIFDFKEVRNLIFKSKTNFHRMPQMLNKLSN